MNSKACNIAVLSELGTYPYSLKILKSGCNFWYRIRNYDPDKLLCDAYKCNCEMLSSNNSNWFNTIKTTLSLIDCGDIWGNVGDEFGYSSPSPPHIMPKLLQDKYLIQWQSGVSRLKH